MKNNFKFIYLYCIAMFCIIVCLCNYDILQCENNQNNLSNIKKLRKFEVFSFYLYFILQLNNLFSLNFIYFILQLHKLFS